MYDKTKYIYVGLDLHKEQHTAVIMDCFNEKLGEITFQNKPSEFGKLITKCKKYCTDGKGIVFALENSYGYGRALAAWLIERDYIVKDVNPALSYAYRKSVPQYKKNDSYDAQCVARVGVFPGSFSLKMETLQQVLFEIFENLQNFGFSEVYCFSYHGDSVHVRAIEGAIKTANEKLNIHVKLVLESMDLRRYGWTDDDDFLLVSNPPYPMEWFEEQEPSEQGLYDIHGGAFETAVMSYMCPGQVDLERACKLQSASLNKEGLKKWLLGGEATKEVVPLGYAGNPAGYGVVSRHVEEMLALQSEDIAEKILHH